MKVLVVASLIVFGASAVAPTAAYAIPAGMVYVSNMPGCIAYSPANSPGTWDSSGNPNNVACDDKQDPARWDCANGQRTQGPGLYAWRCYRKR